MRRLEGKVAVVTGGNSGIGLASAKRLLDEGARVAIAGRSQKTLDEAVKYLGNGTLAVQTDVAKLADLDKLYAAVSKKLGKIDILFVNAGVANFAPFADTTEQVYDTNFDINAKGAFFTIQKAIPFLNDGASIILTGAAAGSKGTPNFGVASATKAAIRSFARTWTVELKDRRIRTNVLSPGPVLTASLKAAMPAEAFGRIVSTVPMGRMAEPEEIAKTALFLGSDDSSFVTGIELFADGGRAQV